MRHPWLYVIISIAVLVAIIGAYLRFYKGKKSKSRRKGVSLIAHTRNIRELPEYIAAKKRYSILLCLATCMFIVATICATTLAARPFVISESENPKENRDIVLCLDVSASMDRALEYLSKAFALLAEKMRGERIGIVIFDGIYIPLSPLTDDYYFLSEILNDFSNNRKDYMNNIRSAKAGTSQIGVGLVGCVNMFDEEGTAKRSRAIVLATDGGEPSSPTVSLQKAAQFAKNNDVTIYSIISSPYEMAINEKIMEVTAFTGGVSYTIGPESKIDSGALKDITNKIMKKEAIKYDGTERYIKTDNPQIAALILSSSIIILMIILWRLRI